MISATIGFFIGIYMFARKVVKNEPLDGKINSIINYANSKLSIYKDKTPQQLFDRLLKLSTRGFFYSFILCSLILLLPENVVNHLIMLASTILFLCIILRFSILWIRNHRKTFKEFFLNIYTIGILLLPSIIYLFDLLLNAEGKFSSIFYPFGRVIEKIGLLSFQLFWMIGIVTVLYFGAILIALPTYLFIYTFISISLYFIKIMEKYIDRHILDGIVGLIGLILLFLKIFK